MDLYKIALDYYEKEELDAAANSLRELLSQEEHDSDAWNFLGIIELRKENNEEASNCFLNCIYLNPHFGMAYYNLGLCYQNQNDYILALRTYEIAAEYLPNNIDLLLNTAVVNTKLDHKEEAEIIYNKILSLKPGNSETLNNLANLQMEKGNQDEAINLFTQAISMESSNCNFYYNLANCYMKNGDYTNAENFYHKTLILKKDHYEALNNLGILLSKKSEYQKAVDIYKELLTYYPENDQAYFNLASCYNSMDQSVLAIENYNKAYKINPDAKGALINLGNIYNNIGEYDKSRILMNKAVSDPDLRAITLTNIGISLLEEEKIDAAEEYFHKALQLSPDLAETHYNLAHILLLKGEYLKGWEEYEWRFKRKDNESRAFKNPLQKGEDIDGKRILVLHEQGLGDAIQFIRYVKLLKDKGAYVIYECDSRLYSLFKRISFIDEIVCYNSYDCNKLEFDFHIHLLSLPWFFDTLINNIDVFQKYISADKDYLNKWQHYFLGNNNYKIGIVWSGNPKHTGDKKRSCPLKQFVPIFATTNCSIYSLQKYFGLEQLDDFSLPVQDLDKYINNFEDTAAVISFLDVILTVDTSVAHLAGALGKPVWLLLPAIPDWRWGLKGNDTQWYPTMKLYRQNNPGNWNSVFFNITDDLNKILLERKLSNSVVDSPDTVYLGLAKGDNFGWGICSMYLKKELSKFVNTVNIDEHLELLDLKRLTGKIFHAITDVQFASLYMIKGGKNIGYTFFENEIPKSSLPTAREYDLILAGSTWCRDKMLQAGIENVDILLQGIDHDIFYPSKQESSSLFRIFSGGKFEYRKGQDMVLAAFKYLQQKYDDIVLINAWYNLWPSSMLTMSRSKHIEFDLKGNTWKEFMENLYRINGLDCNRIITLPLVPNAKLRELYVKTDLGIFPNRCEGGTNLILMEYMACGKPVIATYATGHKDVLSEKNAILLNELLDCKIYDNDNSLVGDWKEADLEDLICKIESAYLNRIDLKKIGEQATKDMRKYTWERSAKQLLNFLNA